MRKFKMTMIGLIVMTAFIVAPVYAQSTSSNSGSENPMSTTSQSGSEQMSQTGSMAQSGQQSAIRVSQLMDKSVQDEQGNSVGKVSDVIINPQGKADYIVVSEGGGFLGGGKLKPIPWDKVEAQSISSNQRAITIAVSQDKLKNAPAFNKNEWQSFTQGNMDQKIRGYYGTSGSESGQSGEMMNH